MADGAAFLAPLRFLEVEVRVLLLPEGVAALACDFLSGALLLTAATDLMSALLGFASGEEIGEKGCIVSGLMPLSINSSLERSGWYLLM